MVEMTFPPKVVTQGVFDALLATLFGLLLVAILCGLPAVLVFLLTQSLIAAAAAFLVVYLGFLAFTVWSLSASERGLRLHRLFGAPRLIPWDQITSVREVGREELILQGWLWPLFPPREFTPCMSSMGHFRIDFDGRHLYYPPRDADLFRQYMASKLNPPPSA